ncbi:MAG: NUDIX hydrolase [Candidatus Micrarchaeaceae archaeon]|jgi:ADP-ribose pyrophosphatase
MSRIVHRNRLWSVEEFDVLIKNRRSRMYKIISPNTVTILPIANNGNIVLEMQYRPAINKIIYEIPAGHIDKGESALHAAVREVEEETGFKANKMTLLTYFYPSPGILKRKEFLFLAGKLTKGKLALEDDEIIKTKEVTLKKALALIKTGKIVDAKTIIGILYYKNYLSK